MNILENVPLSGYSTMRLGGNAAYLSEINQKIEVTEAVAWAKERNLPIIMIGVGSNIVWKDEGFPGLILVNKIMGFEVFSEDEENIYITAGAGENWDSVVERAVATGKSGLEYLSLIPGTVGGAPVQNIGAYGHELAETFVSLEAYDMQTGGLVNIPAIECEFGYRTSRFKTTDRGRFLITSLTLHLIKQIQEPVYYHWLEDYLKTHQITHPSPTDIRRAVIEIRRSRLPDPTLVANVGSFFANPIVSSDKYQELVEQHPRLASWPSRCFWDLPDGSYKVAAGALLEYIGFKDFHDETTGMATWQNQALVLVNEHANSTADLLAFKKIIVDKVKQIFDMTLEQEPELLPIASL
ncbi:UDP-N-acetylmuramate dehydrogenase [Candidatus Saccharibacteria bacterium]|nr:UDP-N-acetylmuramate dehydrogenase [Candidatus Saccharibacteria bacterium]